jgi:polar amino acid transport system permease protein
MNIPALAALRRVVLPQSWRVILPPSIVHVLSMVKETSLVSQIGFIEITFAAKMLTQRGFSALLTYGSALILYFLVGWALASLGRYAERRLTRRPAGPGPTRSPASPPAASLLPAP